MKRSGIRVPLNAEVRRKYQIFTFNGLFLFNSTFDELSAISAILSEKGNTQVDM